MNFVLRQLFLECFRHRPVRLNRVVRGVAGQLQSGERLFLRDRRELI